MKLRRMYFVPILFGALLTGCTIVTSNDIKTKNNSGKFAIRMDNDDTSLKLDVHSSFDSLTDFIEDTDIPTFSGPYTYKSFSESTNKKFSDIHNEYTESLLGKNDEGIQFYKFTFFIKNNGDSDVKYYMDINLLDVDKNNVGECLRVLSFEGPNKQTVYAKSSKTDSSNEGKELIDPCNESLGTAEIIKENEISIGPNTLSSEENIKFTLLFWLEGNDPECKDLPNNIFLNVEVNIKGYK